MVAITYNERLKARLAMASVFHITETIHIAKLGKPSYHKDEDPNKTFWGIRINILSLNRDLELEHIPTPSNRTSEYLKNNRYESFDEALTFIKNWSKLNL